MASDQDIVVELRDGHVAALCDGEEVGRIHVPEIEFRWCEGTFVSMGGIAGVGTEAELRRRGVAGRMMARAVNYFRENGWVCGGVSTGAGNTARRLYSRAGFEYVFSMHSFTREPRPAGPAASSTIEIRGYREGDVETVLELHRKEYGRFSGARKPDAARWLTYRERTLAEDAESVLLAFRDGTAVGYASYFQHWFRISCEICVNECPGRAEVGQALLRALEARLADRECELSVFSVTDDEPFLRELLRSEGYTPGDSRVFKINILDLGGLLHALRPALDRRVRCGEVPEWSGILEVQVGDDTGEVEVGGTTGGRKLVVSGPKPTVTQILYGTLSGWEAYLRGLIDVTPKVDDETEAALRALLPRIPYHHPMDEWW